MTAPPRTPEQRTADTLDRLAHDVDAWIATAGPDGVPHLVPLSFLWDGTTLLISTASASPTARNLSATGRVRLGLGPTRDVVLIEGTVETLGPDDVTGELGDAFATRTGFDPRTLTAPYTYFRIRPHLVQAWREENELAARTLMRNGAWTTATPPRA
ncbi:pyridoxamine 5'-phosphate oxidase family protein [Actinocorallia aurea]